MEKTEILTTSALACVFGVHKWSYFAGVQRPGINKPADVFRQCVYCKKQQRFNTVRWITTNNTSVE
jgi:hypothetical protein